MNVCHFSAVAFFISSRETSSWLVRLFVAAFCLGILFLIQPGNLRAAPDNLNLDVDLSTGNTNGSGGGNNQTTGTTSFAKAPVGATGLAFSNDANGVCANLNGATQLTPAQNRLLTACNNLSAADADQLNNFFDQVSAKFATALSTNIIRDGYHFDPQLITYIASRDKFSQREQAAEAQFSSFSFNGVTSYGYQNNFNPGGWLASLDGQFSNLNELFKRLNTFASFNSSQVGKEETEQEVGYDSDALNILVGADYRLTNQIILGTALGLNQADIALENNRADVESEAYNLTLFANYMIKSNWLLDASLFVGQFDYEDSRLVNFTLASLTVFDQIDSDTEASQWGLNLSTSYDWNFNNGMDLTALGRVNYVDSSVDGFSETGASGFELVVEDQGVENLTLEIGAELRRAYSRSWGILVPQVSFIWIHEFDNESHQVSASFAADPSAHIFTFETDDPDRDYINVLLGTTVGLPRGLSGFIQLDSILGLEDYDSTLLAIGLRGEF